MVTFFIFLTFIWCNQEVKAFGDVLNSLKSEQKREIPVGQFQENDIEELFFLDVPKVEPLKATLIFSDNRDCSESDHVCVPVHICDQYGYIRSYFDERHLDTLKKVRYCNKDTEICCRLSESIRFPRHQDNMSNPGNLESVTHSSTAGSKYLPPQEGTTKSLIMSTKTESTISITTSSTTTPSPTTTSITPTEHCKGNEVLMGDKCINATIMTKPTTSTTKSPRIKGVVGYTYSTPLNTFTVTQERNLEKKCKVACELVTPHSPPDLPKKKRTISLLHFCKMIHYKNCNAEKNICCYPSKSGVSVKIIMNQHGVIMEKKPFVLLSTDDNEEYSNIVVRRGNVIEIKKNPSWDRYKRNNLPLIPCYLNPSLPADVCIPQK